MGSCLPPERITTTCAICALRSGGKCNIYHFMFSKKLNTTRQRNFGNPNPNLPRTNTTDLSWWDWRSRRWWGCGWWTGRLPPRGRTRGRRIGWWRRSKGGGRHLRTCQRVGRRIKYRQNLAIAESRELSTPRDWMLWWSYGSEIWQSSRQRCCQCAYRCQISERLEKPKPKSRGFETSRDLAVRRPSA